MGIFKKLNSACNYIESIQHIETIHESDTYLLIDKLKQDKLDLELENTRLNERVNIQEEQIEKQKEYLQKVVDILKNSYQVKRDKPSKVYLETERMNKISDDAKVKLR